MTTQDLLEIFGQNHEELTNYIATLDDEKFMQSNNGKWTPGQQLLHVYLCLKPINQALGSKDFIRNTFGASDHPAMSYDEVMTVYRQGLDNGGKAPEQYVPKEVLAAGREELSQKLLNIVHAIQLQLKDYTDEELDTLVLPHPFLGLLSIRELFYLMTYHPIHHLNQTKQHLSL